MSYCPDCCSDDVDGIKRGNKRYFMCSVCGAEWVELDNYMCSATEDVQQRKENPPLAQIYNSKK